jgi:hypothetical protein
MVFYPRSAEAPTSIMNSFARSTPAASGRPKRSNRAASRAISAIPITVIPAVMPVVAAMIVTVPPTPRLGAGREERASEEECGKRSSDDLHGIKSPAGTGVDPILAERRQTSG